MKPRFLTPSDPQFSFLVQGLSALVLALAGSCLAMWTFGGEDLKSIAGHFMKCNTSVGLSVAAVSLMIACAGETYPRLSRSLRRSIALMVIAIGLVTLVEYGSGFSLGIDELITADGRNAEIARFPGRMAPNAAFCLVMIGFALLLIGRRNWSNRLSQQFALVGAVVAILALVGYLFEAQGLYRLSTYVRITPHVAACICVLALGVLLARPQHGIIKIIRGRHPSGQFARRMLAAAIISPPLIGWLGKLAESYGYVADSTAAALIAATTILVFVAIVWQGAEIVRESESALQASELQFRTMANSIPQLAWMASKNGDIFWYNERWFDFTDTTMEEMRNSGWQTVHDPEHLPRVLAGWRSSLSLGEPWEDTFPLRGVDSKWRWFLSRARPIRDEAGAITFWFGTHTDVTENMRAENELIESMEVAERANQAKTQFLANMSHEIRTPIGAIIGFTELLKNVHVSSSERAEYTAIVERNSQQLLRLIDDILDLSKVEAGKIAIESAPFSLSDFLADLASVMALRASEKGIAFELQIGAAVPSRIATDQLRLRQILSNVIGNAIKFTDIGSVCLHVCQAGGALEFLIVDTGPGIAPENQAKLFQPFGQADPSLTRKFGGTGLGLILSKRLSEALGGDLILAKSEVGIGSKFVATIIPTVVDGAMSLAAGSSLALATVASEGPPQQILKGLRVLLVEDSPDNRTLIATYLKRSGALIDVAEDGEEGVAKATALAPDVVLMDIQMPKMDGHRATRALRALGYLGPIVALTAHAMREERDRCFESGCTDYLTKPIERARLQETLARYVPIQPV